MNYLKQILSVALAHEAKTSAGAMQVRSFSMSSALGRLVGLTAGIAS